jgi:predicted enzyme related to lactoylglutathione lyase
MEMLDNAITWFEIPVLDFDRAKKFYSAIFDYQMPDAMVGSVRMGFLLYEQQQHRVGGAICFGNGYIPSQQGTLPYLNGGADLNTVLSRVAAAGGKVVLEKTPVNQQGYVAKLVDTEGNLIGLHSRK